MRNESVSGSRGQRGVALLVVVFGLSLIALLINIFIYQSKINRKSAASEGERMRARYYAFSTLEITRLFLRVQAKFIDNNSMIQNMGIDMSQIVPMMIPMFFDETLAEKLLGGEARGLGELPEKGSGVLEVYRPEEGRINLNCAFNSTQLERLNNLLLGLFLDRRYDELFGRIQDDGQILDRQQQVGALVDFIDFDQSMTSGADDEDSYYKGLEEPYLSKNNLLDSVNDIRLIRGVDDIFWANFGSSLSVYGGCQIHLCAMDPNNWQLIAALIILTAASPEDPVITDPVKLKLLATTVAPQVPVLCKDLQSFIGAVAQPGTASTLVSAVVGTDIEDSGDLGQDGIADAQVQGVELDAAKLQTLVVGGSKRYYRIRAVGLSDQAMYSIESVWDQLSVSTQPGKEGSQGAYIYWKED
jgi:type II secretory pathway component PulK